MPPNLFVFAPNELSQDAFIAWLASWGDEAYFSTNPEMNKLAREFLKSLGVAAEIKIVNVMRQFGKIDLLIDVNESILLLIEDKISTFDHGDQLVRYQAIIRNHASFSQRNLICIYFKTGDQARYEYLRDKNFLPYTRQDFLKVLQSANYIENDILREFTSYLQNWEDRVEAYNLLPIDEWDSDAWTGFFKRVRSLIKDADFGYVPNASGGFMGCWFSGGLENNPLYFQMKGKSYQVENNRMMSLRISGETKDETRAFRDTHMERIYAVLSEAGIKFNTRHLRLGKTMNLLYFEDILQFRDRNELDIEATLREITKTTRRVVDILNDMTF